MKKFLIGLVCLVAIAGIGGSVYFYMQYSSTCKERELLVQQNAVLQSSLDAIGPVTTVYTVASEVDSKDVIHAEDFVSITVPTSSVTEDTVTDINEIVGNLYKVKIQPGTTMTKSLVVSSQFSEPVYEWDLTFDFLPLGLEVGDYIDIEIVFPFGEPLTVIPHLRVEQVVENASTIKVWMTQVERVLWRSAMKDKSLYGDKGLQVYAVKYVEPGVNDDVTAFYPVRQEMEALVNLNPNISDARTCVNSKLRAQLDVLLEAVEDEVGSKLQGGVMSESSSLNAASSMYVENTDSRDSTLYDLSDDMEVIESVDKFDANGNTSYVTESEKNNSYSESVFNNETSLE